MHQEDEQEAEEIILRHRGVAGLVPDKENGQESREEEAHNMRKWNKKGVGLVWLWVSVAFTLVVLYLMFSFLLPVMAQIDNTMYAYMSGTNMNISQPWLNDWLNNGTWILHDATYWFFLGLMAALVMSAVIISLRREPNESYYEY